MLRSIGSVTFLALLMVGCGGSGSGSTTLPPPVTYTLGGGTVSGLMGSGLVLQLETSSSFSWDKRPSVSILGEVVVNSNGPFTFDSAKPLYPVTLPLSVVIAQQPSSPAQLCVLQAANLNHIVVGCSQHSYVANAGDGTVSEYAVDASTGALAAVGSPVATGTSPHAIAGTQDRRFVFVSNGGSNDVSVFAVNFESGALTAIRSSPIPAGIDPQAMALWGGDLFVANAGSDNVSAYSIDGAGALTELPGSPIAVGRSPTSIVAGAAVYVANHGGSNDISALTVTETTKRDGSMQINLTQVPGSPFPAGGDPLSLALGAGGNFLYSANPDAAHPSISGFSIDPATGALSPLAGSPFPLPVSHYIATDQTGAYLYVTSGASIVGYAIDATTGALTALLGFPVAVGANAYSISVDPTNQFLYVANDGAANVSGFTLDASTGALTPVAGSPFPAGNRPEFLATF